MIVDIDKLKTLQNNLRNLKTKIDKLDIDKLVPVPVDLSKLSNVINNDVVKKTEYNAKIKNIEDKIPGINIRHLTTAYTNNINYVLSWQSRGLPNLKIDAIKTNNYLLNPREDHYE